VACANTSVIQQVPFTRSLHVQTRCDMTDVDTEEKLRCWRVYTSINYLLVLQVTQNSNEMILLISRSVDVHNESSQIMNLGDEFVMGLTISIFRAL
jgi:hypothetical protein